VKEVLVVDDGSTENLETAIAGHEGNVRLIRHEDNRGIAAARNTGIKNATGQLIAFLDSDDLWLENKLTRQVPYFHDNTSAGLVGGGYYYANEHGEIVSRPRIWDEKISYEDMALGIFLSGSSTTAVCRAEVFDHVGLFDESLPWLEDWEMWLRISRGYDVFNVQKRVAKVRMHQEARPHRPEPLIFARRTRDTRLKINQSIPNPKLRRKALALTYFHCFNNFWKASERTTAALYLVRSFATWPLKIHRDRPRARSILGRLIGRW
jgi:glycosyltransferase involved in cell wall biosynthesis